MSYSAQYQYVGRIDGGIRNADLALLCGCCHKSIPLASSTFVYFDMGPGDFFLVDEPCRQALSDSEWFKRAPSILRRKD